MREDRMQISETQVYAVIGEDGFNRLVRAFYAQVPGDDVLGPMYASADLAGAEERLREFLVGRFGGPDRYIQQRGHPRLRQRHAPFVIDQRARDRWIQLMGNALEQVDLPEDVGRILRSFFEQTATFMINRG
jgi:hemoglobin